MNHLKLIVAMCLTCILVAVANLIIERLTTLNIFTLKVWLIIPIGALMVGFAGTSGAILAARYFNIKPKWIDVIPMIVVAAATMVLIYYLDYATLVLDDGRKVSDIIDFKSYVDFALTKAHMRIGRGQHDAGEVGEAGYYIAAIEFGAFLIGGAATILIIKGMKECQSCGAYLRKLKTKRTAELTLVETDNIIDLFQKADLATMQALLVWKPEERKLPAKEKKGLIAYDLYGCPACKLQAVTATPHVFNGSEWKEISNLSKRRNLEAELSLRDSFA